MKVMFNMVKANYLSIISLSLWGVSLGGASLILFGFWLTRSGIYLVFGMSFLLIGCVLTVAGLIFIIIFRILNENLDDKLRKQVNKKTLITIALLILNFPIAFLFMVIGGYLDGLIYLNIKNQSKMEIDKISISSFDKRYEVSLGALKSGKSIKTYYRPNNEGSIDIHIESNGEKSSAEITEYFSGSSDDSNIYILEDSSVEVKRMHK